MPFLAQRLDQALLQFVGGLLAYVLADLRARLRQRIRLRQEFLPGRLGIERLDLAQLVDGEIGGVKGGYLIDHRGEERG